MKQEDILPGEEFRPVVGFENYLVSNFGRIYSFKRARVRGGFLKPIVRSTGYSVVTFFMGSKRVPLYVHRIVAAAFICNPEGKPMVNHKDGDKKNNFVDNIEWCTASENHRHSLRTGLFVPKKHEFHGMAKLTNLQVMEIKKMFPSGISNVEIAKIFLVSKTCIWRIRKGRGWIGLSLNTSAQ